MSANQPDPARISPVPTDEEAVAVMAAVQALWPRPAGDADAYAGPRLPVWRFSNRWWARPVPSRRVRPYR